MVGDLLGHYCKKKATINAPSLTRLLSLVDDRTFKRTGPFAESLVYKSIDYEAADCSSKPAGTSGKSIIKRCVHHTATKIIMGRKGIVCKYLVSICSGNSRSISPIRSKKSKSSNM